MRVMTAVLVTAVAAGQTAAPAQAPPTYGYAIVHVYPHDSSAFTQGLIVTGDVFFESTGLNGKSSLRKVRLETGDVLERRQIDAQYFAEGLTEWQGTLLQLTWQAHIGFVYDMNTFEPRRTFAYTGEGWGLTHDRTRLILSDGTADLRFLDPVTFAETGRVTVTDRGQPVTRLNELEYVNGEVFANVWGTDTIVRIDPASGRVTGRIDLAGLLPAADRTASTDVLNGIAYDAARDRLFVTGKQWPKMFEIRLVRR